MDRKEIMEALFDETIKALLKRIQDGTATPADLNVARQMLRDNGISAVPKNKQMHELIKELAPAEDVDDSPPAFKFG